mmetsp:Transcript_94259/g.215611  ORF Transcript_94259/g.215611 Transcript_94259/m.215611 type:complete len:667 (+) Transcript_94259:3-2003(+)
MMGGCLAMYIVGGHVASGASNLFCRVALMADEVINGSPQAPDFLGIDETTLTMQNLTRTMDRDGERMDRLRQQLSETQTIRNSFANFIVATSHLTEVMHVNGYETFENHKCTICELAAGNNLTGREAQSGAVDVVVEEMLDSPAHAMDGVRNTSVDRLNGAALAAITSTLYIAEDSLETFRTAISRHFLRPFVGTQDDFGTLETWRNLAFIFVATWALVCLLMGMLALIFAKQSRAKYPSSKPACCAWCCAFLFLIASSALGGAMLSAVVPLTEMCQFWETDVTTAEGFVRYSSEMGLNSPGSIAVAQTCLSANGTGVLGDALGLVEALRFQAEIDASAAELGAAALRGANATQALLDALDYLDSVSTQYPGLFQLVPSELNPTGDTRMIGSSLEVEDVLEPPSILNLDGNRSTIFGLDTYVDLIAGPGRYRFQSGLKDGTLLINSTEPSDEHISAQPTVVRNALLYARQKEALLEAGVERFRCDTVQLAPPYRRQERSCDLNGFKRSVRQLVEDVRATTTQLLDDEAASADKFDAIFADLDPILQNARVLLSKTACRFMWWRWKGVLQSLCSEVTPSILEAGVVWLTMTGMGYVIIFIEYKVWRHLRDNRVVGLEQERYAKKFGTMRKFQAEIHGGEEEHAIEAHHGHNGGGGEQLALTHHAHKE